MPPGIKIKMYENETTFSVQAETEDCLRVKLLSNCIAMEESTSTMRNEIAAKEELSELYLRNCIKHIDKNRLGYINDNIPHL